MTPFLNQSRTKVSPLDEDQGLAPEDHQRASELLWKHGQPCAVWMRGNISVLHDEEGSRPFHSEKRSGVSQRPRVRPWMTSRERPAAMKKRMRVMARPKKNADERRTERFNLRYTVAERETVRDLARRYGLDEMEFQRRRKGVSATAAKAAHKAEPVKDMREDRIKSLAGLFRLDQKIKARLQKASEQNNDKGKGRGR